jgi:uncharacterized protein involved in tolerance to divalent cations
MAIITKSDKKAAPKKIAEILVKRRLAACV